MSKKRFLGDLYDRGSHTAATMAVYDDWAASYEEEISENGYATPKRIVAALDIVGADKQAHIIDIGCGTGLGGVALQQGGYVHVDGSDMNASMLAHAKMREGVYQNVYLVNAEHPWPKPSGYYDIITAMGVIAAGHAPPQTIIDSLQYLQNDGLLAFSLNDHSLENPGFVAAVDTALQDGLAEQLFCAHGEHLPGIGMGANVYVLRRK